MDVFDRDGRIPPWLLPTGFGVAAGAFLYCTSDTRCLDHVNANLAQATRVIEGRPEFVWDEFDNLTDARAQGSEADAVRHCLGSCYAIQTPGVCLTRNRAYAAIQGREEELAGQGDFFSQQDMLNNNVGSQVATTAQDCSQGCLQAWRDGRLFGVNRTTLEIYRINGNR